MKEKERINFKDILVDVLKENDLFTTHRAALSLERDIKEKILDEMKKSNRISLFGLLSFIPMTLKARAGINPKTKESIDIPEKKVYKIKLMKKAIKALNGKDEKDRW